MNDLVELENENKEEKKDMKTIISENITKNRKKLGLTQLELAEKLNYSDKTLSKWERAESIPDIITLKELANIFGITVDELIGEKGDVPAYVIHQKKKMMTKRNIISVSLLSVGLVWLIAILVFVVLSLVLKEPSCIWLTFISAFPVTAIVLLVFSCVWGNNFYRFLTTSILVWSIALLVQLILCVGFHQDGTGLIYIVPIPLQIMAFVFFFLLKKKK